MKTFFSCSRMQVIQTGQSDLIPKKGKCMLIVDNLIGTVHLKYTQSTEIYGSRSLEKIATYKVFLQNF